MSKLFAELIMKNIIIENRVSVPPMSLGHTDNRI